MNGDWCWYSAYHLSKDADLYIALWNHLRRLYAEEGADNVLWVWNDFLLPYLILGKPITIPLSQMYFYGQYNQQWHLIMAGFVVTTIPVILFYIFMQKNIVNGIAAGAIKG